MLLINSFYIHSLMIIMVLNPNPSFISLKFQNKNHIYSSRMKTGVIKLTLEELKTIPLVQVFNILADVMVSTVL